MGTKGQAPSRLRERHCHPGGFAGEEIFSMATQPEPKPDTVEPGKIPEIPPEIAPDEEPASEPEGIPPIGPDFDPLGPSPEEIPPDELNRGTPAPSANS
jgi:hypothetical protein